MNIPTTIVIFNIKIMLRLGKKTIKLGKTKIDNSKIINIKMMSFSKEDKMKKKCLRMIKKRLIKINFNFKFLKKKFKHIHDDIDNQINIFTIDNLNTITKSDLLMCRDAYSSLPENISKEK